MPDHTDLPAAELASRLGSGLLSFPVTHFTDDLAVDERSYREHVAHLGDRGAAGLFAAGGTGEFFSLSPAEVDQVVTAAVQAAPPGLPVLGSVGVNAATAVSLAHAAERAGASGLLLMPPYLTEASQDGLAAYVRTVCAATQLGVIVYNRGNAVYADTTVARLAEDCPTLIGFKDGVGSIEQMTRVRARLGDRLLYVGGLPTAELYAWPYQALGVTTYSSAIFNFLPEFALAFYRAVRDRNETQVQTALRDVVIPFTDLRNRRPGYAVSIVKAGLRVVGRPAGPVRPPLTDLDDDELAVLTELVDRAHGHRVAR